MSNNARNYANIRITSLNNESNPDTAIFTCTVPTDVAANASTIVPYVHIPPSGQKQHTKPFYPMKMNNMSKEDTIYTTPAPNAPTANPADASAQSPGFTVSKSPYLLKNHNFPTSSIQTKKLKKKKYKWW